MHTLWVSRMYVRVTFQTFRLKIHGVYMHTQLQLGGILLITPPSLFIYLFTYFFNFIWVSVNFLNVPLITYTYVWLVFALNIIFKLVWENLPCIMLPPLSDTHSQQCLTECNIQLFYQYNKIPSPFLAPPDKNQQSAIISAKPIHSSHFF